MAFQRRRKFVPLQGRGALALGSVYQTILQRCVNIIVDCQKTLLSDIERLENPFERAVGSETGR